MNERLKNNALLNLAKFIHTHIMNLVILAMFFVAANSNHLFLAFIIFVLFIIISVIGLAQLILFVVNMRKANKK